MDSKIESELAELWHKGAREKLTLPVQRSSTPKLQDPV